MIKTHQINQLLIIIALCTGTLACASSPDIDHRPKLLISAEKSLELGVTSYNENNYAKAEAHFQRALYLYRNTDNPAGIISSCLDIAKTKLSSGQTVAAKNYTEQAKIVIKREQINSFNGHLAVIESSIAIDVNQTDEVKNILSGLLNTTPTSGNASIRTAALQNRTRIAFLENNNAFDWVQKYEEALNKPGQDTLLNRARLLRFKAELETENAPSRLSKALILYRKAAHSPGIAATLTEWAVYDLSNSNFKEAADKLERALFIRTNLHDKKNTGKVLALLATSYNKLGAINQSERANNWQRKLDSEIFEDWDAIRFEFENYPG